MKIRRVEITEFGRIHNRVFEFSDGLNIFSGGNKENRKRIHEFIKRMLYGPTGDTDPEEVCQGTLWFQVNNKEFRLTRKIHGEEQSGELFCETSGEILNAEQTKIDSVLGNISENIFDNGTFVSRLKNAPGPAMTREIQNYITAVLGTADKNLDLGHTMQMLKMSRKGFQVQVEHHKKDEAGVQEILDSQIKKIQREIRDLEDEKEEIRQQEISLKMTEEDDGDSILEEKVHRMETRNFLQTSFLVVTVLLAFAGALILWMNMRRPVWAAGVAALGVLAFLVQAGFQMKTVRELEKRRRYRKRWLNRQQKLREGREELDAAIKEKMMAISNIEEEKQEREEHAYIPLAEEMEIDALNLSISTINRISGRIWNRTGDDILAHASGILNKITEGRCEEIILESGSRISVRADQEAIPVEKLHRGTQELLYFAFCMAFAEVVAGAENLPVILDDVFERYGQEQFLAVLGWLSVSGHQSLIYIANEEEVNLLGKAGIGYSIAEQNKTA